LGGLLALWGCLSIDDETEPVNSALSLVVIGLGLIIALGIKETGVFFVPLVVVWLLSVSRKKPVAIAGIFVATLIAAFFHIHGYEKPRQLLCRISNERMVAEILGCRNKISNYVRLWHDEFECFNALDGNKKPLLTWNDRYRLILWPFGLIVYLFIMLPWRGGFSGYYFTPAGVFIIGTLFGLFYPLRRILIRYSRISIFVFMGASPSCACILSESRSCKPIFTMGTLKVIPWIKERAVPGDAIFAMPEPCLEAHEALANFMGGDVPILYASDGRYPLEPQPNKRRYLITQRGLPGLRVEWVSTRTYRFFFLPMACLRRIFPRSFDRT